jgi:YD repeat-containing protein
MQQGWFARARATASEARQRDRRRRRLNLGLALGLAFLLAACSGQDGTTAVQLNPLQPTAAGRHVAKPAPKQRWGSAAGMNPVVDGPRNTFKPKSLRSQYPVLKAPSFPANSAKVVKSPTAAVRGFSAGASREIPAERSAHQRVYDNADGTQTTQFSAAAVNYRKPDGTWAPIDSTLVKDPAGGWRRSADSVDLRVADRADAAELVRVTLPGGGVLAYGAQGAGAVPADVSGDTARFAGVWKNVDIELQAQAGGVKDTLVLGSAAAPRSYVFPLRLTGLTAAMDGDRVVLRDTAGAVAATIPAGYLVDAKSQTSPGVTYKLITSAGAPALQVSVDADWLTQPGRAFPVRLDPPVLANGAASESLIVQGDSSHSGGDLVVGRHGGNSASYLRFPEIVSSLSHETIYSAQLSLAALSAPSCKARPMSVYPVTESWSKNDTGQKYPGPSVGAALATTSFAQGYVALGQSSSACPVTGTVVNLGSRGRDLVQGWVDGKANNGLGLRASIDDELAWKTLAGLGTANPPKLYVTHSPYNAKYAVPDPTPKPAVLQNQAGKVKVTVTNKSAMDWTPSGFRLVYRVYNAQTNAKVGQYIAANLPATVARNASATLEATIKPLPVGQYLLDFSMSTAAGRVFTDELVPPARIALRVDNIAPVVGNLFPPNGYQSPTLTPQLWAQAIDLDAPPKQTLQYKFEYCAVDSAGKPTGCTTTAYQAKQSFTIPAAKFKWTTSYLWRAFVKDNTDEISTAYATLITSAPQPEITSRVANAPYGSSERDFDPDLGNFNTGAVDATIPAAGPVLNVTRTYNSLDPRRDQLFGAGWMTQFDLRVVPDADGSGNAVVTYADGQQVRFGRNADGTYAAPPGRTASLTSENGFYLLRDVAGTLYTFRGTDGKILQITDKWTRALVFSYTTDGRITKVLARGSVSATTGRALTFGWNAANTHVTSVSTDPLNGRTLTWTYAYDGDLLKTVCAPGATICTNYTYTPGSHYRSGVLDSDPDSYWRFGEKAGAAAAGSEIGNNLGKDAGVLRNVALEQPGALPGTDNTSALFNGTTSVAELPKGIVKRSRDTAVELWFKMTLTQTGGPLVGYQDKAVDSTPTVAVPLLYVGSDGHVRGQFKTTATTPKPIDGGRDVRDNKWHHVALSVTADVQSLYVDGAKVGSKPATDGVLDQSLLTFNQVGAGWAPTPASWPAWGTTAKRYFNGSADEVAVYGHALSDQAVKAHWTLGTAQADQLSVVTQPSGKIAAETVYDTDTDRVKEYTDGNGGTWKIGTPTVYGGDTDLRRAVRVLDPADRPYLYEYDALAGRMLRSGSPLGLTTRAEDKPLPSSPSPAPSPTEVCSSPDPGEPQFCNTIPGDAGGPIFEENELTGMVIRSFGYDALGRQNQVFNENGESVTMTFDARGNVITRRTCRKPGDCQTSYTSYTTPSTNPLDPRNDLPFEVRDPRSASATDTTYRTTTVYTATGDVQSEKGPDDGTTVTAYTQGTEVAFGTTTNEKVAGGLVASVTDAMSRITKFRYTARGDLAQVTAPSGLVTEYSYDALGRKIADKEISDSYPAGVITTYAYDDLGRPTTTTGPVTVNVVDNTSHQAVTTKTYDLDGNVVRTSVKDALDPNEPERVTTIEYDQYNHQTRTTNPVGDEQVESWDVFGNRVSVLDGNGNQYGYAYTARNALAEVRLYDWHGDPDGGKPQDDKLGYVVLNSYAYDFAGRMAAQADSMGRRLEYSYFSDDLVSKIVQKNFHNPDGTTRDFVLQDNTYDAAGNVTRQAVGNQTEVTTNVIDPLGRTASTTFDPGGLNRATGYIYDKLGNVTQTTQTGSWSNVPGILQGGLTNVVANVYNAKGQLTQTKEVSGSLSRATSYTYDQRGLAMTTTDPRGNVTTYQYDQNGDRTASIAPAVSVESGGNPAQTATPTVTTGYNAFGEAVATKDPLGNIAHTKYDRIGRVVEVDSPLYTAPGSPGVTASAVTTTKYDALNNVVEKTDARGNVSRYTYDRMNRVVQSDEPSSTNDERAVTKYTYTRTGKLLSSTSPTGIRTEATYDDLDRQITSTTFERKPVADTLTTTTTYDDAGNVTQVKSPGGLLTTMKYNRAGDLISTTDPASVTTQIGYDPFGNQTRETDGAGRTTRRFHNGFGDVTAEVDQDLDGNDLRRETYDYDDNGNIIAVRML